MSKFNACSRCGAKITETTLHMVNGAAGKPLCTACLEKPRPHLVVLSADPAWKHDDQLPGPKRGASAHYDLMSVEQIERMTLPQSFVRARNAVLFLWLLESMQLEALRVALAWNCQPYTSIVWNKTTAKTGAQHFGMGRLVRGAHERCLIAVRGQYKGGYEPAAKDVRSAFTAPMPVDENGRIIHSAKPEAFFKLVEQMYPSVDSRHEMFARRTRPGWLSYGLEVGKLDGKAAQ